MNERILDCSVLESFPAVDEAAVDRLLNDEIARDGAKFVVLDDDPTGVQTVHDIPVVTDWAENTLKDALRDNRMFFVLTNSRSFTAEKTAALDGEMLAQADQLRRAAELKLDDAAALVVERIVGS